jgi:hypothetical protein
MYLGVIRSRPTAYSKITIQHLKGINHIGFVFKGAAHKLPAICILSVIEMIVTRLTFEMFHIVDP